MRKLLFFLIFLVIVIIVISFYILTRKDAIPTETVVQKNTGVAVKPLSSGFQKQVDESQALRKKSPLDMPEFTIVYDYKKLKFIVTFKNQSPTNREFFQNWLQENNFESIPAEKFQYSNE